MTGEYEREFGKFPQDIGFQPLAKWQQDLRRQGFDADDYVFMGQVKTKGSGSGHGGIRFGPDGWAWLVGLGKMFGRKTGTLAWGQLEYLEIRRDPFSISFGNVDESVQFVAVTDVQGFAAGEMADVLMPRFDLFLKSGTWQEADKFPSSETGAFGGQVEALWKKGL